METALTKHSSTPSRNDTQKNYTIIITNSERWYSFIPLLSHFSSSIRCFMSLQRSMKKRWFKPTNDLFSISPIRNSRSQWNTDIITLLTEDHILNKVSHFLRIDNLPIDPLGNKFGLDYRHSQSIGKQEAHHKVGLGETARRSIRQHYRYSSLEKIEDAFDIALDFANKCSE